MNSLPVSLSPELSLAGSLPLSGRAGREPAAAMEGESAAAEFESMFISMLLKEMRQTLDSGLFAGDASDTYGVLFDQYMGQHLAHAGGLGLGSILAARYEQTSSL